ncbi:GyrI-like domain-containing protein [Streptomyces sp. NPDC048057]|uniref:GyrI-like domain-containing protein n=1 Tax=Streptomyces sp. NPDC048057 TaxID=3155628 RepID=UPI0033C641FA
MNHDSHNETATGPNGTSGAAAGAALRPVLSVQPDQPYAFIRGSVRMDNFGLIADRLGELIGWLSAQGAEFAGAPFFRFNTVDMDGESDVEAGVPVVAAPAPEGDIQTGALPAGRYATVRHTGHPDQLFDVITALRTWADEEGLTWDMTPLEGGAERWGCRLESYLTDPSVEPDMDKWEIELSFRLADTD